MLGNSLASAERDLIPEILAWIFKALKPGGILCVDQREWTCDPAGRLIQANRTENTLERKPGHDVAMGDTSLRVHEICEYADGFQRISYRVQQLGVAGERPERAQWFELYYTPFQVHETVNWFADTGYTNVRVKAPPSPPAPHGWPYWMVTAERPTSG